MGVDAYTGVYAPGMIPPLDAGFSGAPVLICSVVGPFPALTGTNYDDWWLWSREALRVMGNPESGSFQAIVKAFLQQETAEHVEHWYDRESLRTVSSHIPSGE